MVQCFFNEPKKWGPHVWYMLDMMIIRLNPDDEKMVNHVLMQFVSLMETIPCDKCRSHYKAFIETNPIEAALSSQLSLAKWVHNLRSEINRREKKPNIPFEGYLKSLKTQFQCDIAAPPQTSHVVYSTF